MRAPIGRAHPSGDDGHLEEARHGYRRPRLKRGAVAAAEYTRAVVRAKGRGRPWGTVYGGRPFSALEAVPPASRLLDFGHRLLDLDEAAQLPEQLLGD